MTREWHSCLRCKYTRVSETTELVEKTEKESNSKIPEISLDRYNTPFLIQYQLIIQGFTRQEIRIKGFGTDIREVKMLKIAGKGYESA